MAQSRNRLSQVRSSRATMSASWRVRRKRHFHQGPLTSRRAIPVALIVLLFVPAVFMLGVYGLYIGYQHYVSDFVPPEQLALNTEVRGSIIYDRHGRQLYEFLDEEEGTRLPISLDQVSPAMIAATIATEDSSYYTNPGVNVRGLARAGWENFGPILNGGGEEDLLEGSGGSSITQQLVKNIYIPPEQRTERSLERKIREAAYAVELTMRNDKDEILEWYFNHISYGGLYNGVEAAAQGYFGKPASELTLAEAALLAGIPQTPARYDPINRPEAALERRNEVLDLMARVGKVQIGPESFYTASPELIEAAKAEPITVRNRIYDIEAPHFVMNHVRPQVINLLGREALYRGGLHVYTTIDLEFQNVALENLERWIAESEAISGSHNGALIVLDNSTGEVLVHIGSRDYFRQDIDGNVDNLMALNSPGSSFKPFVYLAAFLELGWTPSTRIDDAPVTFRESDGTIFRPENPVRGSYMGNIPISTALGNSLNIPPFRVAMTLGVDRIVRVAEAMGFTSLTGQYGPSIAIGGVDLTAYDLAYGYSVLANNGTMVGAPTLQQRPDNHRGLDPITILRIEDAHGNVLYDANELRHHVQVVPPQHAYMVTSILADPQAVCATFGCGGLNVPGHSVAVKTGTSSPFDPDGPFRNMIGETWSFGYTPDYVVGVWAGNSDNAPIRNIYSTTIAFRAMRDTIVDLYRFTGRTQTPFQRPSGIEQREVCENNVCRTETVVRAGNNP